MKLSSPVGTTWPTDKDIEHLRTNPSKTQGIIFFEALPIVAMRITLMDGTVISGRTLPAYCVESRLSWHQPDDWVKTFEMFPSIQRRWHGYVNSILKTDVSWRAQGIIAGAIWDDSYRADPFATSTLVGWAIARSSSRPSRQNFDALRASIKEGYERAFRLVSLVHLDTPLDRAILSFGLAFTQRFTDERFVSLWRVLESMTLHQGLRKGSETNRVHTMVSKIDTKWTPRRVKKWWTLRSRILHEGTTEENYRECGREIGEIYECAARAVEKAVT